MILPPVLRLRPVAGVGSRSSKKNGELMAGTTFAILKQLHDRLDELFLLHQEALFEDDLGRALERLDAYEVELRDHIRLEEELLLPVYRRAGLIPGGRDEFYTGEHERLGELLERCRSRLVEVASSAVGRRRGLISLFDLEATFKSLCDHHHQREENLFFPALDRVTDEAERQALLARCLGSVSQ
jgi:hemerythrin-like domain-containing protein